MKQLPTTMSGLMDLMISALKKAEEHPRFTIKMHTFFERWGPDDLRGCAAGMVAVDMSDGWERAYEYSGITPNFNQYFGDVLLAQICNTFDCLRMGVISSVGRRLFNDENGDVYRRFDTFVEYPYDPTNKPDYYARLEAISSQLKEAGL